MINKKKMRFAYWWQRASNAMGELRYADAQGCEKWFANDGNVPADANYRGIALAVEAHVKEFQGSHPVYKARARRDIFIWEDMLGFFVYSKEVGKDALYVIEFDDFASAETFINGLPIQNCGYGFVLDLLPAKALQMMTKDA